MQLRQFVFAVALAAIGGVPLSAQTVGAPGVSGARGANPKDVESVDAIISALYDANSLLLSPGRDTARFRSLFLAGARLMPVISMPAGAPILATRSIDEYIHGVARIPSRTGFREREISRTSQAFGNIVHVFSTYETRRDTADTHPGRGINSIQLFFDGTRWWIVNVLYDNEGPGKPIPTAYLPRSR